MDGVHVFVCIYVGVCIDRYGWVCVGGGCGQMWCGGMQVPVSVCMWVCVWVCVCVAGDVWLWMCVHTCVYMWVGVDVCARVCICVVGCGCVCTRL